MIQAMARARRLVAWSTVAALVVVAGAERWRRASGGDAGELLDWGLVRRTAAARCPAGEVAAPEAGGPSYDALVAEMLPWLTEVCGPGLATPQFETVSVVDRHGFVDANITIMRRVLGPVAALQARLPGGSLRLSRLPLSLYTGFLLSVLAGRVLGQYDPLLRIEPLADGPDGPATERPRLLMVDPNVSAFVARAGLPAADVRRWLTLHELTHAWQFEAHPWLAQHLSAQTRKLVVDPLQELLREGGARRGADPLALLGGLRSRLRPQIAAVRQLQAVMTVCEGHGNYVMREVGRRHLPGFDRLDAAFHQRQTQRTLVERVVFALTGLSVKLRQYERGEAFLRQVEAAGGAALLDRLWDGPEAMPSWAELRRPQRWVERIQGPAPAEAAGPGRSRSAPSPA